MIALAIAVIAALLFSPGRDTLTHEQDIVDLDFEANPVAPSRADRSLRSWPRPRYDHITIPPLLPEASTIEDSPTERFVEPAIGAAKSTTDLEAVTASILPESYLLWPSTSSTPDTRPAVDIFPSAPPILLTTHGGGSSSGSSGGGTGAFPGQGQRGLPTTPPAFIDLPDGGGSSSSTGGNGGSSGGDNWNDHYVASDATPNGGGDGPTDNPPSDTPVSVPGPSTFVFAGLGATVGLFRRLRSN